MLDVCIRRKAYKAASGLGVEVMRDLQFQVGAAQVVAIMGPSGCGKSTLLRMIAGLDRDFDGEVTRASHGRIGMVFQEPTLLNWRSVEENIRLVMREGEADAGLLDGVLRRMELEAHRGHYPGELSVGLARRVGIGRALAACPGLLLMDEPFASLDGALTTRLQAQIKGELELRPTTTLLVTHSFDDALRLADRVLIFSARPSRIVADIALGAEVTGDPARIAAIKREIEDAVGEAG